MAISVLCIGKKDHTNRLDLSLIARAFGASQVTFIGKEDRKLINNIQKVNEDWGGSFRVNFAKTYYNVLESHKKYIKVYITRYGLPFQERSSTIGTYKNILVILTLKDYSESINKISDFNVCITQQPHRSKAALAIFLHDYYKGRELSMHFENAKYKLVRKGDRNTVDYVL